MRIGLVTIIGDNNYGNRLQNYAVQEIVKSLGIEIETLRNIPQFNGKKFMLLSYVKEYARNKRYKDKNRLKYFKVFNQNIHFAKKKITYYSKISNSYDYFITGSDQVWNPHFDRFRGVDLLSFARNEQKIAFSASFGVSSLPEEVKEYGKKELQTFKAISVREQAAKEIIQDLTDREDVQVLVDPTMLLTAKQWDKVAKKPKQEVPEKYILSFYLGKMPEEYQKEIQKIAQENDCKIVEILNPKDPLFRTGPSEFLYLIKNAFLICTDSFHGSVFSIIYDKPFINFERKEAHMAPMNSRIETLLSKFHLENRKFQGEITQELLTSDYTNAKEILEQEKEKSIQFLKKALEIEK